MALWVWDRTHTGTWERQGESHCAAQLQVSQSSQAQEHSGC